MGEKRGTQGYIIEYTRIPAAGIVKVTAIDPETGHEASIMAPAHASKEGLAKLAMRKLRYVIRQK